MRSIIERVDPAVFPMCTKPAEVELAVAASTFNDFFVELNVKFDFEFEILDPFSKFSESPSWCDVFVVTLNVGFFDFGIVPLEGL